MAGAPVTDWGEASFLAGKWPPAPKICRVVYAGGWPERGRGLIEGGKAEEGASILAAEQDKTIIPGPVAAM